MSARTSRFQSTPSARRATVTSATYNPFATDFNPRPPRGGRPGWRYAVFHLINISIHALREEGDSRPRIWANRYVLFQSTPSARRATGIRNRGTRARYDFNPRPPRGGRRRHTLPLSYRSAISIHALREEGDCGSPSPVRGSARFQSTPSARRATQHNEGKSLIFEFQSTPSARRATLTARGSITPGINFNPRPPRGGRPMYCPAPCPAPPISIHALREEGD